MSTSTKIISLILIVLAIAGGVYWYLFFYGPGNGEVVQTTTNTGTSGGFVPLNAPSGQNNPTGMNPDPQNNPDEVIITASSTVEGSPLPTLRLLSNDPIGGYGASTTASTTIVRWIDRGRGNILEAFGDSEEITTLSNTLIPRMYESIWNKNLSALVGSIIPANTDVPTTVYAKLNPQVSPATTTSTERITPYFLRGKNLPENMITYAVSPKSDKLFMLVKENSQSAGYISNLDGTSVTKIFVHPLTQLNAEWPEEATIAITTKASANNAGYLYFVNPKTGVWKKILGPITGLSTKVSKDARYVLTSGTGKNNTIITNVYPVSTTTPIDTNLRTLAEKCTWGNFYKELLYCATPSEPTPARYPDDWYKGSVTSYDKIWQINITNGDIRLVSSLINQADRTINVFNISTDARDDYLFFMNKDDLSFWSLDLNSL